jgi:hypothetical protein
LAPLPGARRDFSSCIFQALLVPFTLPSAPMIDKKTRVVASFAMPRLSQAVALRCIAQDLDRRGIKSFDIRLEGETYYVDGGYQDPPSPAPVSIEFTRRDLEDLDRSGEGRRGEGLPGKEFMNQAQVFRTIGAYLDKNDALLLRLTNNHGKSVITVEYIARDGERIVEDRAGSALYDMCVQLYKQRGRLTGTEGLRTRRRY